MADETKPIDDLTADDPTVADVTYWDGLPEPEYAKEGDEVDKRIEERRQKLLRGEQ